MKNVVIINGHQPYHPFAPGRLNSTLADMAAEYFAVNGCEVARTLTAGPYDVDAEIDKLRWADLVIMQMPLNWFGMSWSCKKYVDEVWTHGMAGTLSDGDGRTAEHPGSGYGTSGKLRGRYMLSVTGNVPATSFGNVSETFFNGISAESLLLPVHLIFRWLGLKPVSTYFAFDVNKNPRIVEDLKRFETHLRQYCPFSPNV